MISYQDRTFCPFYKDCIYAKDCDGKLTDKVMADARKWWGNENAPVSEYETKPECHTDKHNSTKGGKE